MATEVPRPYSAAFQSPPSRPRHHHLAELRIEPAQSSIAFSAPCTAGKRRCLLPPSSPRKKMLLELHPFDSLPSPSPSSPSLSPTPSPRRSPATAPPALSSRAASSSFPASDFSFPSGFPLVAGGCGGGGGGNMFAFFDDAVTTPTGPCATPTGSSGSALSFLASPGRPATPTGSTATGGFTFVASPKQPTTQRGSTTDGGFSFLASPKRPTATAGPTANGGFVFLASPEQPLTPTGSNASGGCASLSCEPSLSPKDCQRNGAIASLPSPTPASTASIESGGFAFFPSPGPAMGNTGPPEFTAAKQLVAPTASTAASPPFVFSAWPADKPRRSGSRKPRRHLRLAIQRRRNTRPREEKQPVTPPRQKVAKTVAGVASRSSIQSASTGRPCCTFFASPAKSKAAKQEDKSSSSEASRFSPPYKPPAGPRQSTSRARPSSVEKTITQEQEVEVSSSERKAPRPSSPPAACSGAGVLVRVTCKCGAHKDFSFDHSK